jgi:hypothetical protein
MQLAQALERLSAQARAQLSAQVRAVPLWSQAWTARHHHHRLRPRVLPSAVELQSS